MWEESVKLLITDKELNKEEVTKADRCRDREIHTEIIQHKEDWTQVTMKILLIFFTFYLIPGQSFSLSSLQ